MFHAVTVRVLAIAACGWLLAQDAAALTLGRARGAALIGRPLEVTVPVTLDGASPDSPCPSAEVFYGDSRTGTPAVRWEATGPSQGLVRVSSGSAVDEPMVTVYLRVGCTQPSTRRYVLLAELPPEDEPATRSAATRAAQAPQPAAATAPVAQAPAAVPPPVVRTRPPRETAPAAAPRAPAAAKPPAPRARREAAKPGPKPQARLRLEPLDLSVDRDPVLRLSSGLAAPSNVDPQRREALAALWQAAQRTPEQSLEEVARLQGLERELGSLREATRQNAAAVAQLKAQVDRARGDRDAANGLVVALALALAALLGVLAWRWYRLRQLEQVGRWFDAHGESMQAHVPTAPEEPPTQPPAPAPAVIPPVTVPSGLAAATPAPARAPTRAPAPARAAPSTWGAGEEFAPSRGGTLRMVGVQELIDVHDKADFFLSIGETEQAIAALEAHVHDQVETGALAWMDLLELYHSLGRRAEFERLRGEFRQRFTAQVPDFEHFDQPSPSLETYGRALSRIVALWPSRRVLDVIEESIFRKPDMPGAESFTLEAYRELVLLYHIARDMAPEQATRTERTTGFRETSLQPLHALDRPEEPPLTDRERLMIPPPSARLGVDIDLDAEPPPARDLPHLDFDMSTFDPAGEAESGDKGR